MADLNYNDGSPWKSDSWMQKCNENNIPKDDVISYSGTKNMGVYGE